MGNTGDADLADVNKAGRTALHCAAFAGHEDTVTYLLGARADADAQDSVGLSPLELASPGGHREIEELLAEAMDPESLVLKLRYQQESRHRGSEDTDPRPSVFSRPD